MRFADWSSDDVLLYLLFDGGPMLSGLQLVNQAQYTTRSRSKFRDEEPALLAGVAWTATGYTVSIVDPLNAQTTSRRYGADGATAIADHLTALEEDRRRRVVAVIESSNGTVCDSLLKAGLTVCRADPRHLPAPGPGLGAADDLALAAAAQSDLNSLTRLSRRAGLLTGRLGEVHDAIRRSPAAQQATTEDDRHLRHGRRSSPSIAITFNDGPDPVYTPLVLGILKRFGVSATFFCVGLRAAAHPHIVRQIAEEGHQLGNHTWSRAYLPDLSRTQLAAQIERTADQLESAANSPIPFRPPYGAYTPENAEWLHELDQSVALWDVAPADWAMPGSSVIARRVVARVDGGSIIALHDGGGDRTQTVAALPLIFRKLLKHGYQPTTLDRLTGG
ncbi:polysaccharide deacetylase family protein [Actinospica sp. MGRD01-02]|uniref:Polysaccharide deacetylase family protein n=1 Tax=Actinospica acidithermotolerans TaxID=2828514 RepID=A0A941IJS8_9ACTN|nr:polysaccharide deacetylase family protein [Actinospica acidithermotolerans]MBR7826016.1 polysaccharide deacetylase family protein [Actinospica acidithermotolerans]